MRPSFASGGAQNWWLRSINLGNTTNFYNMNTSGDWNNNNASNSYLPAAGFHPREDRV